MFHPSLPLEIDIYISVLHARLRNKCSNLNNNLFINHIRDNPLCDLCGVVEDAIHCFFYCRRYTIDSQVFNDTVRVFQPLSINQIIFGNENSNFETNSLVQGSPQVHSSYKSFQ